MLDSSENDKIFSMEYSFMWTVIRKNSSSPILLKYRWPPLVIIRNFLSALNLRTFLAKLFIGNWLNNRCSGESNCHLSARSVGSSSVRNYELPVERMFQFELPQINYKQDDLA